VTTFSWRAGSDAGFYLGDRMTGHDIEPGPLDLPPAAVFDELVDKFAVGGLAGLRQHIDGMCPGCATACLVHAVELAHRSGKGYCTCDTRRHDGPPCELHAPTRHPQ
jgi:hypothetical protein